MKVNEYEIIRLKHDVDKNHRRSHSEVVRDIKYTFVAISDYMGAVSYTHLTLPTSDLV